MLRKADIELYFSTVRELGAGAFGKVFSARPTALALSELNHDMPDIVAVKIANIKDAAVRDTLAGEIAMLRKLDLKYGLKYYGCLVTKTRVYIVMEYMDSEDLHDLSSSGGLNMKQKNQVASQLARGVAEMHDVGVIHRDIKPGNILVRIGSRGKAHVKIIDYGLSCYVPTMTGACNIYAGTLPYMDPALTRKQTQAVDFAAMRSADWWAFARTLVVMYTERNVRPVRLGVQISDTYRFSMPMSHYSMLNSILLNPPSERPSVGKMLATFSGRNPTEPEMLRYSEV
jgi:serine/threonine protein kinase